jgi:hypothetical protein
MSWPYCSRARWSLAAAAPPLWRACAGDERFHRMSQCSAVEDNKSPGRNVPVSAVPARMCAKASTHSKKKREPPRLDGLEVPALTRQLVARQKMPQRLIVCSPAPVHEHDHQAEAQPVGCHAPSFVLRFQASL